MRKSTLSTTELAMRQRLVESTHLSLSAIAKQLGITVGAFHKWVHLRYTKAQVSARFPMGSAGERHPNFGRRGSEASNWQGGKADGAGYKVVHKPSWWTGPEMNHRIYEHRVVYCEANDLTEVPAGYHVHHIDHVRTNNEIGNLQLMTATEHARYHNLGK